MKSLTFDEFFATPPGTIFGQATGLPHQDSCGLYRKCDSFPEDEDGGAFIDIVDLINPENGKATVYESVWSDQIEDDHRFLVYEPDDLDRLARLIGRPCRADAPEGPAAAHGADGGAITWERYNQ